MTMIERRSWSYGRMAEGSPPSALNEQIVKAKVLLAYTASRRVLRFAQNEGIAGSVRAGVSMR